MLKKEMILQTGKKYFPVIFFLFLSVGFFWKFFFLGLAPIPSDLMSYYFPIKAKHIANPIITDVIIQLYPFKALALDGIRHFAINFWNPYLFSGEPFIATVQAGYFYPLNMLGFFLDDVSTFSLILFSQLFLGGLFMYIFLRELKLHKLPAYFGSVAFIFAGPFAVWFEWGNMDSTIIWLPLVMYFMLKAIKNNSIRNSIFAGIALGFSALAGHFQILLYVYATAFIFVVYENIQSKALIKKKILNVFVPFLLSLILGVVQIISSLQIGSDGYRINVADYHQWQYYPFGHFLTLIMPNFFGNPVANNYWGIGNYNELSLYSGVITLFFVPLTVLFWKDRRIIFFGALFLITILVLLGTPIYAIPYRLLSPLQKISPLRIAFLFSFFMIILSSLSLEKIFFGEFDLIREKTETKIFIYSYIAVVFIIAIVIKFLPTFFVDQTLLEKYQIFLKANFTVALILILLSIISLVVVFKFDNLKLRIGVLCLLFIVNSVNLFIYSYRYNPFCERRNIYPANIDYINFIKKDAGVYRVFSPSAGGQNVFLNYGLQTINGYDSLYPKQYLDFMRAGSEKFVNLNPLIIDGIYPEVLDLLNVKYVIIKDTDLLSTYSFKKVFSSQGYTVYENSNVMNRAFLVQKCVAKNPNEILDDIKNHKIDFKNEAEIEGVSSICKSLSDISSNSGIGNVDIESYGSDKVMINADAKQRALLVLTDSFQKGWKAYVDGKQVDIVKTDYNFRGVLVEQGIHNIEFKYNPFF